MAAKGDPHSLCPSPQGEFTSRHKLQGSHTRPAPASWLRGLAALPPHLVTCPSVGEAGGGTWVSARAGGKSRRLGQRGSTAAPPLGGAAQAQWPYRRQGAATWRSERRRRGFTTTVSPVVAAVALSVASATVRASAPASTVASSELRAFRSGGSISARRGRVGPGRLGGGKRGGGGGGTAALRAAVSGAATAGNKPESNPPPRPAGLKRRRGSSPVPRRWWMLRLRGDGRGAGDEAGITVPAEAAPLLVPSQERGIWRARSQVRGGSSLSP